MQMYDNYNTHGMTIKRIQSLIFSLFIYKYDFKLTQESELALHIM